MKKIFAKLLLTPIIGLIFNPIPSTYASMENNGTTWWSVEELLEFNQEVEAQKKSECGRDKTCEMDFYSNMIEKGPKYSALVNLLEAQIWVTSVNPATETVKVLFLDDDMMLKLMGTDEKLHLEHLYMGWNEDWNGQIYNYDYDEFTSGSLEGNHLMYSGSSYLDGKDWIPAWEEHEISVAGSDLTKNTLGRIDYAVFAEDSMYNAQGYFDYSMCLESPDYKEGMECKMMVSGDQWVAYFPPQNPNDEDLLPTESDKGNSGDILDVSTNSLDITSMDNKIADNTLEDVKDFGIKAPNTGSMTNPCIQKTIEFPWWLVILIALGDVIILWLFWPKSQKNSKKTLDKINQVR